MVSNEGKIELHLVQIFSFEKKKKHPSESKKFQEKHLTVSIEL